MSQATQRDPGTDHGTRRAERLARRAPGGDPLRWLYYGLKPFLPLRVRYSLRRLRASRMLRLNPAWPISESAAKPPRGWTAWPGGKSFAVVLTHDVEGQRGVDRVRPLADLESRLGFRSSYNFVPEGEYRVPRALREQLVAEGFEIGVHDWRHDGRLFSSRRQFSRGAERINFYLQEWQAVGFRAGFMFHELDWIADLNLRYDASTFDIDPFEPQPEGVNSIFPFWVYSRRRQRGYVELPYTLPQDSTLLLILREKSIDLWRRKIDWIAAHGGMVLLNLHPDYVQHGYPTRRPDEYASRHYEHLLRYIDERYAGAYWHALPREVAEFYRAQRSTTG